MRQRWQGRSGLRWSGLPVSGPELLAVRALRRPELLAVRVPPAGPLRAQPLRVPPAGPLAGPLAVEVPAQELPPRGRSEPAPSAPSAQELSASELPLPVPPGASAQELRAGGPARGPYGW